MARAGLHVERTELAWIRMWLAAATASAIVLRLAIYRTVVWLAVVVVVLLLTGTAFALQARHRTISAALLCIVVALGGVVSAGSMMVRLSSGPF